ncbi:MAG TPA: hypothetical protein IAC35_00590 [Candidatus Cryptobacteroides merdipullorum]|uniref:Lipoprotein n=1 Tax=Candidatus Cryptobacteroides merdipullorum TaxID=2840771 RepID=A0A9D1GLG3_9BACT|nr:hypothetical protein [Candidatus Cryptobacteroides merdipullorum]
MIQFVEFNGRFRAAVIMALLLSGAASCARIEIVPRQEPESGAIVFAPKVETGSWFSISPASASSVMHRDGSSFIFMPSTMQRTSPPLPFPKPGVLWLTTIISLMPAEASE